MRWLIVSLLLVLTPICRAEPPNHPEGTLSDGWQSQCFGRLQFSMPSRLAWFNQENEVTPLEGAKHPSAIWSGEYGRDPLHIGKWLVRITVNRAATLETWRRETSHYLPNEGAAKQRYIQSQIDAIDAELDYLRIQYPDYYKNPEYVEAHSQLSDKKRV